MTQEEFNRLVQEVTDAIQNKSNDPGQFELATSLQGIESLPVLWRGGDTWTLKRVLISLLKGADGREIELRTTSTAIQWRYVGGQWTDLISREALLQPAQEVVEQLTSALNTATARLNDIDTGWSSLSENIETAVAFALEVASHPTYIGEDNYTYQWSVEEQKYIKTNVYVRGERGPSGVYYGSPENAPADVDLVIDPAGQATPLNNWTNNW